MRSTSDDLPDFETTAEPEVAAAEAGLRYVSDSEPGIRRRRFGKSFAYFGPDGGRIDDPKLLDRIARLAIPPAYTDVWICRHASGHLQATGRDARGRKQYRYHPRWREVRDSDKYGRMLAFARALPAIRARVEADMGGPGLSREKLLATILRLLETSLIRVGNEAYAKANRSFGLTTLRSRHVDVNGSEIRFAFRAKSGKEAAVRLRDRRVARVLRRCQELPGQLLFQYLDEAGERRSIDSADVNGYLRDIAGQDFTAKDFRTWAGSVLAGLELLQCEAAASETAAKRNIADAIKRVSARLGNTPAICRKCYIHPEVLAAYADGTLATGLKDLPPEAEFADQETAVLVFLERRLEAQRPTA